MTGRDQAMATVAKLKKELLEERGEDVKGMEEAKNALAKIQASPELVKMYQDNALVGATNLAGELPLLKIHATGRSQNQLNDGSEPDDGSFFYKPTKEQYKEIDCHILTISKGFRADGFEGKKDVFHQILAGVIINEGDLKPFVMYFTGVKLDNLWKFGKEASIYTKAKPVPLPMFTLKVKLTTERVKHSYGMSWVVNFGIMKDGEDFPLVVADPELFTFLRDHVDTVEDTIASLIAVRSTGEENEEIPAVSGEEEKFVDPETNQVAF